MKGSITRRHYVHRGLVVLCATLPLVAGAASMVTVKVTVVAPPPCIINGNRVIEVDFGDVIAPRVDGSHYLKTMDYTLDCQGSLSNAMKLAIQGTQSAFDNSALQTNIPDLGIQVLINGKPRIVGDWLSFTYPDKPRLQAVPVKRPGADLPGGGV